MRLVVDDMYARNKRIEFLRTRVSHAVFVEPERYPAFALELCGEELVYLSDAQPMIRGSAKAAQIRWRAR